MTDIRIEKQLDIDDTISEMNRKNQNENQEDEDDDDAISGGKEQQKLMGNKNKLNQKDKSLNRDDD